MAAQLHDLTNDTVAATYTTDYKLFKPKDGQLEVRPQYEHLLELVVVTALAVESEFHLLLVGFLGLSCCAEADCAFGLGWRLQSGAGASEGTASG